MDIQLEAQQRLEHTKSHKRLLREKGMVPAIMYGRNTGTMSIAVDARELKAILDKTGPNTLIDMRIKGGGETEKFKVLVKSLQRDPVRQGELIHADFQQVSLQERVRTTVRIRLAGQPRGVAAGGILTQLIRRVEVECLPAEIPEAITVDISGLDVGEQITVAGLDLPPGVKVLEDRDDPLVTIVPAQAAPVEVKEPAREEAVPEAGGQKPEAVNRKPEDQKP